MCYMVHRLSIVSMLLCSEGRKPSNLSNQEKLQHQYCPPNVHLFYINSGTMTFPSLTTALKVMDLETCHKAEDGRHVEIV